MTESKGKAKVPEWTLQHFNESYKIMFNNRSILTLSWPLPEHVIFTVLMCTVTDNREIIMNDYVCSILRKFLSVH